MIQIYNSLKRQKEKFAPINPAHIRVYACGPTVYDFAHIGNARMAVVFDLFVRVLRHDYPKVTYVSNITDVEDKIMDAAKAQGVPIDSITSKYARIYNDDMAALGVDGPDVQPLATAHITEMIDLIERLIARGHAYVAGHENEKHVLFHVPSDPAYGVLSGRSRDEQIAGARVEISPFKKDPADFVLWKPSSHDQPGWDSPWGFGRPGWHIECSAMAEKHLGLPFDIHGGGADLKFPHHENEIAQSCCAHGIDTADGFAKYWMHNGFVTVDGEKMSKSLGNFLTAHDLLEKHDGETLRLALLSAHYRQPLDWSDQALQRAKIQLDSFYQHLHDMKEVVADEKTLVPKGIIDALRDDLNTPLAISQLHTLLKSGLSKSEIKSALLKTGKLLGILQKDPAVWLKYASYDVDVDVVARIEKMIASRTAAKANKNYGEADAIRKVLESEGIILEDRPGGTVWKRA